MRHENGKHRRIDRSRCRQPAVLVERAAGMRHHPFVEQGLARPRIHGNHSILPAAPRGRPPPADPPPLCPPPPVPPRHCLLLCLPSRSFASPPPPLPLPP